MDALKIAAPFVGSVVVEVVHWYQLRDRLHLAKYRKLIRSGYYWVPTIAVMIVCPLAALIVYGQENSAAKLLVLGAAFPTLLVKLIASTEKNTTLLGGEDDDALSWRDYFRVA